MSSRQAGRQPLNIRPGQGLGQILFGMTRTQVRAQMGSEGTEALYEDGDVHLDFNEEGVTFFFEGEESGRLTGIEVDQRCNCMLWGANVWDLKDENDLTTLVARATEKDSGIQMESEINRSDGERRIGIRSLFLDFYLRPPNSLNAINWSVVVDSSDEPVWPEIPEE